MKINLLPNFNALISRPCGAGLPMDGTSGIDGTIALWRRTDRKNWYLQVYDPRTPREYRDSAHTTDEVVARQRLANAERLVILGAFVPPAEHHQVPAWLDLSLRTGGRGVHRQHAALATHVRKGAQGADSQTCGATHDEASRHAHGQARACHGCA